MRATLINLLKLMISYAEYNHDAPHYIIFLQHPVRLHSHGIYKPQRDSKFPIDDV